MDKNRQFILLNYDEKSLHSAIMTSDGRFKLTRGSYENGIYDKHQGDSGRNPEDPPYNISAILSSDVNTAFLKLSQTTSPLTERDIIHIRSELDIEQFAEITNDTLTCKLQHGYCLFDLFNDPYEMKDIQNEHPEIFIKLKEALDNYAYEVVPQTNQAEDLPACDPKNCNDTWFSWGESDAKLKCFNTNIEKLERNKSHLNISYILLIVVFILTLIYSK